MIWSLFSLTKKGKHTAGFLRIALKDSLIHSLGDSQHPIQLSQNNLPSAAHRHLMKLGQSIVVVSSII